MILYTYAYSSAAFRVRIVLNLKGLQAEHRPVHLRRDGGRQHAPEYVALNPLHEVPTLDDGGRIISQSMAIAEYLEETHPQPPLLPRDPFLRAKTRQVCEAVNSGIHPLGNLKVLQYLETVLALPKDARDAWYRHWVGQGLERLEALVRPLAGRCALGDEVTLADCFLVPQVFNAHRNRVDTSGCPTLNRLWETCIALPAFAQAHPERQPDAQP